MGMIVRRWTRCDFGRCAPPAAAMVAAAQRRPLRL